MPLLEIGGEGRVDKTVHKHMGRVNCVDAEAGTKEAKQREQNWEEEVPGVGAE